MNSWMKFTFLLLIAATASAQDASQIKLSILDGDGQATTSGHVFAKKLAVQLTDTHGIPFQGTPVYFESEPCYTLGGLQCDIPAPPGHFQSGSDNATVLTDSSGVAVAPPYYAGLGTGAIGVSAYAVSEQPPYFLPFREVVGHIVDFHLTETPAIVSVPILSPRSTYLLLVLLVVGAILRRTDQAWRNIWVRVVDLDGDAVGARNREPTCSVRLLVGGSHSRLMLAAAD